MKNVTYINAGAGSGKTYTLTKILSEYLVKENGLKPSQVILTTFTELAAAEFREKARKSVLESGNTIEAAQLDSAMIGTVHSVAYRFIKKFWYLLEYGADIKTISESDASFYMNQSLSTIAADAKNANIFKAFEDYEKYFCKEGNSWNGYLRDIVESMEYYDVSDLQESKEKSIETLNDIFIEDEVDTDALRNYLKSYYNYIESANTDAAKKQREQIKPLLNFSSVFELSSLESSMMRSPVGGVKKIETKCPGFEEFRKRYNDSLLSSSHKRVIENYINALFDLAELWRNDFIKYKQENHIISYNDMEKIFLRLLTDFDEVKDYVRENYKLVMVDEFQDSNPIQIKIFNVLSEIIAENDGRSYWVGDPKQAIYAFRGADADLISSITSKFKFYNDADSHDNDDENGLGTRRLTESWRSRESLVTLVNDVFEPLFAQDGVDPNCIKLDAHFTEDNLSTPSTIYLNGSELGNAENFANALAGKVKAILDSKMKVHKGSIGEEPSEISPKDIAILCMSNDKCLGIIQALQKYDVPVSQVETELMQCVETQLLVSIMQFIQQPYNKHVIADLMKLLWGKSTEEVLKNRLEYLKDNGLIGSSSKRDASQGEQKDEWMMESEEVQSLMVFRERVKDFSITDMVRAVIYENDIIEKVARWSSKSHRAKNLSLLQNLAAEYDQRCVQMGLGASINGFINFLSTSNQDKKVKDNVSDTVKVITYHSSKGLEWPLVILTQLEDDKLSDGTFIKKNFMKVSNVVVQDGNEDPFNRKYYIHIFPNILRENSSRERVPDVIQNKITVHSLYKQLKEKQKRELKRVLYVGMTRAKDYLYTVKYKELTVLKNIGITPSDDNFYGVCAQSPEVLELVDAPEKTVSTYTEIIKASKHTQYEKRYISPSKIEKYSGFNWYNKWPETGLILESKGWSTVGFDKVGTCIHDVFAVYRYQDTNNIERVSSVIKGHGLSHVLDAHKEKIMKSAENLYKVLMEKFPQKEGDKIYREYPFQMTMLSGQILRGEMDMLWYYTNAEGEKCCVLVDYKTFPGVDLANHTKDYYPQLSAYADVLTKTGVKLTHTLIYYPVQGVIMELQKNKF